VRNALGGNIVDSAKLKRLYAQLLAIRQIVSTQKYVTLSLGNDYNKVVKEISAIINEDLIGFSFFGHPVSEGGDARYWSDDIREKLLQLISYLEYGYNLFQHIVEVGSIYNSISDEELKSRCSDILSAPGNFDRVINQATLVLEERIRKRSGLDSYSGVELVNKALNSELSKSVLQVSDDPDVHEGIAHICRGIVLAFRNPTHHRIITDITREDALKVCAFIDKLLQIVDATKPKSV